MNHSPNLHTLCVDEYVIMAGVSNTSIVTLHAELSVLFTLETLTSNFSHITTLGMRYSDVKRAGKWYALFRCKTTEVMHNNNFPFFKVLSLGFLSTSCSESEYSNPSSASSEIQALAMAFLTVVALEVTEPLPEALVISELTEPLTAADGLLVVAL